MTDRTPNVTAVIVTYQSRETIGAALDALREAHDAGLADAVVVDNASTDGTADYVAEQYPWMTLTRSDENLGYGRGCNKGFEHVATEYVLVMNPDAIINAEALANLVQFMVQTPQAGLAGPAIIESEKSIQAAGLMTTPMTLFQVGMGRNVQYPDRSPIEPGGQPFRTNWICGAAMLIRSDLFRALDGFDPRFFLYFEETDLCRRATDHGAEIWAVGNAVARHIGGASAQSTGESTDASCISEHFYRSRFYYLVKHFGWVRAVTAESFCAAAQWLRRQRNRIVGRRAGQRDTGRSRPFLKMPTRPANTRQRNAA